MTGVLIVLGAWIAEALLFWAFFVSTGYGFETIRSGADVSTR